MSGNHVAQTVMLTHNHVNLALHKLRDSDGPSLLILHGLGESSPSSLPRELESWPGAVWALDFTGHGYSTVPRGGGYSCEILLADVDIALRHIGAATIISYGIGAYVALLAAGARPEIVRGVILCDGPGLAGGPTHYASNMEITSQQPRAGTAPDPWALIELGRDARPANYASTFVRLAVTGSSLSEPITVCCKVRPPWLEAIVDEPSVETSFTVPEALEAYARSHN